MKRWAKVNLPQAGASLAILALLVGMLVFGSLSGVVEAVTNWAVDINPTARTTAPVRTVPCTDDEDNTCTPVTTSGGMPVAAAGTFGPVTIDDADPVDINIAEIDGTPALFTDATEGSAIPIYNLEVIGGRNPSNNAVIAEFNASGALFTSLSAIGGESVPGSFVGADGSAAVTGTAQVGGEDQNGLLKNLPLYYHSGGTMASQPWTLQVGGTNTATGLFKPLPIVQSGNIPGSYGIPVLGSGDNVARWIPVSQNGETPDEGVVVSGEEAGGTAHTILVGSDGSVSADVAKIGGENVSGTPIYAENAAMGSNLDGIYVLGKANAGNSRGLHVESHGTNAGANPRPLIVGGQRSSDDLAAAFQFSDGYNLNINTKEFGGETVPGNPVYSVGGAIGGADQGMLVGFSDASGNFQRAQGGSNGELLAGTMVSEPDADDAINPIRGDGVGRIRVGSPNHQYLIAREFTTDGTGAASEGDEAGWPAGGCEIMTVMNASDTYGGCFDLDGSNGGSGTECVRLTKAGSFRPVITLTDRQKTKTWDYQSDNAGAVSLYIECRHDNVEATP